MYREPTINNEEKKVPCVRKCETIKEKSGDMINIKVRVVATSIGEGGAKQETEALWGCWGKGF